MTRNDYIHLFKEACADKCNAEFNPCVFRQAADSLAALKPVLWKASGDGWSYEKPLFPATPLYAIDGEQA
jgi:hypothetical protein